jgi:hypothetical protein
MNQTSKPQKVAFTFDVLIEIPGAGTASEERIRAALAESGDLTVVKTLPTPKRPFNVSVIRVQIRVREFYLYLAKQTLLNAVHAAVRSEPADFYSLTIK